ncbi:efflux RND transporter periplasmic adaptor subunit [Chitinophaga nivalis]|uniref:Efflux RND transporter periplasmic adaptor subunit n=1 Tax=Chitinophaga nivalis TaxID=2991709 RepID=A0ABT3IIZ2_9BACT|nr:efflux RND transporter periplasmic adaptor subunit [Chitinophaga nivalis]MCW3466374.1 efflux RND transporter periplasmic adaptor subunit [Chitinophaga nivalis]MCW3483935.1 efflux RND transporter periplasmic adaptor subunit [Chitinophaga nivalis]
MKRIIMLMGLYALLCHTSCKSSKGEEKEAAGKFLVTSPVKMDTSVTREYVCQISSIRNIELRAQEKGYLQRIAVDEGQSVKAGQLLFSIMPQLYEAEQQKAAAEARAAEIEVQNIQALADKNIVSQNELALAKAKLQKAQAELSLAKVHLAFTTIKAPFDGIIDRLHLKQGSLVGEGDLLSTLSDNSRMWVYFNVSEPEYLDYEASIKSKGEMKVNLLMANKQVFKYPGVVETIEGEFNHETGNIAFRATFPNPDQLLRHGETGSILMNMPLKDALIIPQKATMEIMDKKYVFVVTKDNVVKLRPITIAAEMPDLYVIKEGLAANEKILLEGLRKVKDNDKISFDYEEPGQVISHLKLPTE